jgi:predicted RNA-binding Zn ribbon-like protein
MLNALTLAELPQFGGHLALDFANTQVGIEDLRPHDALSSVEDYRLFASRNALEAGDGTNATLTRARKLRDLLIEVFRATVAGRPLREQWLDDLTQAIREAYNRRELVACSGGLNWLPVRRDLDSATDAIAIAAVQLLESGDAPRIRQCGGDHCGWFFLDKSRNGQRRWCSMRYCGNRAKVRRHRIEGANRRSMMRPSRMRHT